MHSLSERSLKSLMCFLCLFYTEEVIGQPVSLQALYEDAITMGPMEVDMRSAAHSLLIEARERQDKLHQARAHYLLGKHYYLRYLGEHATEMLLASVSRQQSGARTLIPALTRREKEVLQLIMQGMSDAEISGALFMSPTTAESHRKNLRSKLGARNSAEIVRIAMERGLV